MTQNSTTSAYMVRRPRGVGSPSAACDNAKAHAPKPTKNTMRRARWYHKRSMPGSRNELRMSMAKKHAQKSAMPPTTESNKVGDTF